MKFVCAVVCLAGFVGAERFDPARVRAEARWVAHVDVEALAKSDVYAALVADGVVSVQEEVELVQELGLDPVKDLRGVTVYGVEEKGEHTVVVLDGEENLERALEKKKGETGYREEVLDGKALHAWGDDCFAAVLRREGSARRLVVQSDDRDAVSRACAVIEGRGASLAGSEKLRALPAEGSIVWAASTTRLAELDGLQVASNVVKLAEDVVFDLGESHGELFATLRVDAERAQEARQIQQVLQGAVALVGLVGGDDPELGRALQDLTGALRFTTEDTQVRAEFRMSTRLLLEHLRTLDLGTSSGDRPKSNGFERVAPEKRARK